MSHIKKKCIFLDRDGVIIKDSNYISDAKNVVINNGISKLFRFAAKEQIPVVIVTNQSGIGRGYYSWEDYLLVTAKMLDMLEYKETIAAIYANSASPGMPFNSWRKPNPGMLLKAAEDYDLDLYRSVIIGDRFADIEAGMRAGVSLTLKVEDELKAIRHEGELEKKDKYIKKIRSSRQRDCRILNYKNIESIVESNILDMYFNERAAIE